MPFWENNSRGMFPKCTHIGSLAMLNSRDLISGSHFLTIRGLFWMCQGPDSSTRSLMAELKNCIMNKLWPACLMSTSPSSPHSMFTIFWNAPIFGIRPTNWTATAFFQICSPSLITSVGGATISLPSDLQGAKYCKDWSEETEKSFLQFVKPASFFSPIDPRFYDDVSTTSRFPANKSFLTSNLVPI